MSSCVFSVVKSPSWKALACLTMLALAGCHPDPAPLHVRTAPTEVRLCGAGACADTVQLTYLGVGGFVIRSGGQAIMTAPSFTHPGLAKVLFHWTVRSDSADVAAGLAGVPVDDVTGILVGHSHYDHLLDVPTVLRRWAPRATAYGGPTMVNILAGDTTVRGRARSVAADVGSADSAGTWVWAEGRRFRFMPLRTQHAPNLSIGAHTSRWLSYTIANGVQATPRASLPRSVYGWKLGEPYAWLIDVMDSSGTTVAFRLFYQDAAADARFDVLPPLPEGDRRPVDVAIVCVGNYGNVREYPDALVRAVAPRFVVLGHWEDFFRSSAAPAQVIRFTNTSRLGARLDSLAPSRYAALDRKVPLTFVY